MPKYTGKKRDTITGFENPASLPEAVRQELESGNLDRIATELSEFLRSHEGADEIFFIVEREDVGIQYHVVLHENGDTKVNMSTVPKKLRSGIIQAV